ncbi:MAG: hypothetical protein ABIP97_02450 [Chthoniobacterales bacterium]
MNTITQSALDELKIQIEQNRLQDSGSPGVPSCNEKGAAPRA